MLRAWCLSVCLCACSTAALAQSLDDALGGFDGAPLSPAADAAVAAGNDASVIDTAGSHLTGSVALGSSYSYLDHQSANGTQWHGLSKLRTRLNLQMDHRFSDAWQARVSGYGFYDWAYGVRDRDRFSNEVLDDYQHEADWQEVWLRGKLSDTLDIKAGRQVVNWGRADSLRVLDVLNPLDNREPGLTDIEDIRLPVTMLKTDWFVTQQWHASLIVIPEVRFSKNPPAGSDFTQAVSQLFANIGEKKPDTLDDTQVAASLAGTFSGWDISFHAAQLWRDTPYLHVAGPYSVMMPATVRQQLSLRHSSMNMFGVGANIIEGGWLLKSELAVLDGVDYTTSTRVFQPGMGMLDLPNGNDEKMRTDLLLGVEYFGFANTALALELANRHISDFEQSMEPLYERRNRLESAVRYTGNFMNDRLEVTALAIAMGERAQEGALLRLQAAYDLQDALILTVGVVDYRRGDLPPFTTIENNDRVFAELKYSF
jgi:hypothetical protein